MKVLERTKKLVPAGAASEEQLERDTVTLASALQRELRATEELKRLRAGFRTEEVAGAAAAVKRAEASRDLAKAKLEYVEVRSPSDGVVLERFVSPGSWLLATDPRVVSLYDPDDLQVRVDIRQENAARLRVGQKAEVSIDAEPGTTWASEVIRVEPMADFKKNTLQAKLRILKPGPSLHPEMICRVRFASKEKTSTEPRGRPTVPESAIFEQGGKTFVFVVRQGRARRIEVRLGEASGGGAAVEAGVNVGDHVVLHPTGLSDGDEVTEAGS